MQEVPRGAVLRLLLRDGRDLETDLNHPLQLECKRTKRNLLLSSIHGVWRTNQSLVPSQLRLLKHGPPVKIKSQFAFNYSKLHQNSSHGFIIKLEIALSSCKENKGIKQLLEAANGLRSP